LLTREDPETQRILDNVVFLMVPCFNPDGQIMVTDWYEDTLGTEYEGVNLPWLYHKYTGHDNNRDGFMTNIVESQYIAKIMFQDWTPQAYVDHHHMGSYGARFYIPPYSDPIHPHGDPLVWREHSWYGAHMAYMLEEKEKTGIINSAIFSGWAHMGFHWIGIYHNIASMLTESANAKLATPLYIHKEQLHGAEYGNLVGTQLFPEYEAQTTFPHPWEGGWWRLRDIVEQQKISSWATLDIAAKNKKMVLRNAYLKAKRQIERGEEGEPKYYVVPKKQHDSITAEKMIDKLLIQGLEIDVAEEDFVADERVYQAGSYILPLAQPKRGLLKTLLGRTFFPDNPWTRHEDGSPYRPYDTATDTMAEFMGVRVDPVNEEIDVDYTKIEDVDLKGGEIKGESQTGYIIDCALNESYTAVNKLLDNDVKVYRTNEEVSSNGKLFQIGSFFVESGNEDELEKVAEETGVNFYPLEEEPEDKKETKQLKVGMYQRYWGGNMDEGWTRLVLEQFEFPYTTLMDEDILEGDLNENYDTIILPNDNPAYIVGGEELEEWAKEHSIWGPLPEYPPEYRSGIGEEGVEKLKTFVENGGTIVTFGDACKFAMDKLGVEVKNVVEGLDQKKFYCPGSTLRIEVDNTKTEAYGMPEKALALFWNTPVFEIQPQMNNEDFDVVATYPERDILRSGWLIGEDEIKEKIAVLTKKQGEGKIVLIGFRPQHRAQTHGTYKLVFNNLLA
ncbi:MAG: M14 family zinc carboxypeptidase, partial [Candidatus Bathyarchaeia archaeon]